VKYLCMIFSDESMWAKMSSEDAGKMMTGYVEYTKSIRASGHHAGGARLEPTHTATTVRVRNGKTQTTDGPYAETKEQLGGYYVVEARDLNEAISVAARIPGAMYGAIEVRPIAPTPAD
jgi:hypothetical protein